MSIVKVLEKVINAKQILERPETVKLVEENIGNSSLALVLAIIFGHDTKNTKHNIKKKKNHRQHCTVYCFLPL